MGTLGTKNYQAPKNPDIQVNPKVPVVHAPQAWLHKGNWYYNWRGAMQEAAFRRERLPTVEELIDFLENRDIVGTLEFVGELIQGTGKIRGLGVVTNLWTSQHFYDDVASFVYLNMNNERVNDFTLGMQHGFSVRPFIGVF